MLEKNLHKEQVGKKRGKKGQSLYFHLNFPPKSLLWSVRAYTLPQKSLLWSVRAYEIDRIDKAKDPSPAYQLH